MSYNATYQNSIYYQNSSLILHMEWFSMPQQASFKHILLQLLV